MASTTETNFSNFYNNSPNIIILDKRGVYYNFSNTTYNNGYGGSSCSESDSKNYANGRKFGNFRDGDPWNSCWVIDMSNYTNKGSTVSDVPDDNAWDDGTLATLNTIARDNIPGYKLKSGGSYNNNSHDYIVADRGSSRYNFSFAVYIKKTDLEFFNDFIGLGGTIKTKFLTMASNDASYVDRRYNTVPDVACVNVTMPQVGKDNCAAGAAQWCRDSPNRIWGDAASALTSANKCYPYVQNGSLDNEIIGGCNPNLDILNNPFCKDQRVNSGSTNIKNTLAAKLASAPFCGNDVNINDSKCVDVKNACSYGNNAFDNTSMPNYQCNTLIKNLNNSNKISMLANTNLTILPAATWTQPLKTTLISSFNSNASTAVSDALCNIAMNSVDPTCKSYIQSNFSSLVNTSNLNPILVMYFAGDNFTQPVGMSSHNSLSISSITKTSGIGTKAPTSTLGSTWCAKFYVYITPSSTDNYSFKINADDDAKLYLNNTLIIDAWGKGCCKDYVSSANINLNPANGPYLLYVEYRDTGGAANIVISYKPALASTYNNLTNILTANQPNSGTSPLAGLITSTLYMSSFNPYLLTSTARALQSISYCKTNNRFATNENCLGSAENGYVGINNNYISEPLFSTSILNYCTDNNRFATDTTFCNNPNYKSYILNSNNAKSVELNTAIDSYCKNSVNNTYATGTATSYCKTTDNTNTNNYNNTDPNTKIMNDNYAKTLRDARLFYVNTAITNSLTATDNTKGMISKDVEDYITTDYPNIQTKLGKNNYPNSAIIKPELFPFCENAPDLYTTPTEKKTSTINLCNAIYTSYNTDPNIIASAQRKNDFKLGIQSNAFMSKDSNNKYVIERDSPEKFAVYLPYAIKYCETGDNIVDTVCQKYYNNIAGVISNGINKQYNTPTPAPSAFTNKESFNGRSEHNYDDDDDEDKECKDSNMLYIFLLFLFVIVLVMSLGGLSKCRKPTYFQNPNSQSYQYR